MHYGYMGQVLDVNLSSGRIICYELPEKMLKLYVGNKGLANRLLYEMTEPGIDPLGPDNLLIVSTSPLTGAGAPSSSRFNVTTKSPLTGGLADSNCGGNFGVFLKRAGYDVLIVRGKAASPVYLEINEEAVNVKDASGLWGLDSEVTQEKLPKRTGKIVIGPAGENLVKYACIVSEERVAGRGGVGAVMGSKNLKAVVTGGSRKPRIFDGIAFKEACSEWRELLKDHPTTGQELPAYGTAINVNRTNATNTLPTRNFKFGQFEYADDVSGETLAEKYLVKNIGCYGCPVNCGRQVNVDGKNVKGPEYETLGMMGPNLYINDLQAINEWNRQADLLGMDTISLGGTLAFVMEAAERGLLKSDLAFGKTDKISKAIEDIAYRRGLGNDMAEGSRFLAQKYGGSEFSINSKGLELAAYEPRGAVGHGLGYAVATRGGCHIGGGYVVYFEANGPINVDPLTATGKAGLVVFNQAALEAISTLGSCIFTSYTLAPEAVTKLYSESQLFSGIVNMSLTYTSSLLAKFIHSPKDIIPDKYFHYLFPHTKAYTHCTGIRMSSADFFKLGQRTNNISRLYNLREGMGRSDDSLPYRLTDELQRSEEPNSKVPIDKMLPQYYKLKGWDKNGVPTKETLSILEIDK